VATAYFAHSSRLMAQIAQLLGRDDEAVRYATMSEHVQEAWCRKFVDASGRLTPDTQANHVRALAFDLVPAALRPAVAARLVELIRAAGTHLGTGFLATPYLLPVLAEAGHAGVAFELLFQDTEPSWLVMVDRGATTMWEHWNGVDADGVAHDSLNHYAKGAVVSFLHRHVAGLSPIDPAYRRFRVRPTPGGGITWARAVHESPYGRIEVKWELVHGALVLDLTVPPGTTADVTLPGSGTQVVGPGRTVIRR
jgi:alpha-L-rhamnosidase